MGEQARTTMGPREVFAHMRQQWLGNAVNPLDSLLAADAVIETPFALPGRPRRFEGREEFLAFAQAGRAALPVRFEECREIAVHDTADPEVIVVEYELAGTVTTTGHRAAARSSACCGLVTGRSLGGANTRTPSPSPMRWGSCPSCWPLSARASRNRPSAAAGRGHAVPCPPRSAAVSARWRVAPEECRPAVARPACRPTDLTEIAVWPGGVHWRRDWPYVCGEPPVPGARDHGRAGRAADGHRHAAGAP
jgi:ketosteroid isomerase-like protein